MHELSSFLLAYHGCEQAVGEKLLDGEPFVPSKNSYDWLGPGIYFWETNPARAMDWAKERAEKIKADGTPAYRPFVVGAVIHPGFCLDLISASGIQALEEAYRQFEAVKLAAAQILPKNVGGADKLKRTLDCSVIEFFHKARERSRQQQIDTVRGVFIEGEEIYPGSGFRRKTHIQLCVVNPAMIKGVFRVAEVSP